MHYIQMKNIEEEEEIKMQDIQMENLEIEEETKKPEEEEDVLMQGSAPTKTAAMSGPPAARFGGKRPAPVKRVA